MATWSWPTAISALGLAAAIGCAEGSSVEARGDGGGGGEPLVEHAVGCSASLPCTPGSTCVNGACATGCNGDIDCGEDEYCALELGQVCQPRSLPSCPDAACTETQVCVLGLCGTQTGQPCGPNPFTAEDGCPPESVCLSQVTVDGTLIEDRQCYTLPPCGPDASCPLGTTGGFCSSGVMADKEAVCLPGLCLGSEHCPSSFACVRSAATDLFGHCTDGAPGQLCATTADCATSTCLIETAGLLGICQ